MDIAWPELIAAMHASGRQAVLAITGGGTGAIAELLRIPGGSKLLLEALVPYDGRALAEYLGSEPEQACSAATAAAMARRARTRAAALAAGRGLPVGLGATASLVSDRPKRGAHRVHIGVATDTGTEITSVELDKGRRDRAGEEDVVARAILLCLARGCAVPAPSIDSLLAEGDRPAFQSISAIEELVAGDVRRVTVCPDGRVRQSAPVPRALLPGSFNPLHEGHLGLARVAGEMLDAPVHFELSVLNVDKPPLAPDEVQRRVAQFAGRATVELTRAPTFLEKARLFPNATFVIGADTAERLVAVRYYGDSEPAMHAALGEIADRGGRFLVAVRRDAQGRVRHLGDIAIPPRLAALFTEIPEHRFRVDLSSTELRARQHR